VSWSRDERVLTSPLSNDCGDSRGWHVEAESEPRNGEGKRAGEGGGVRVLYADWSESAKAAEC